MIQMVRKQISLSTSPMPILPTSFCDPYAIHRADCQILRRSPPAITCPPGRDISTLAVLHRSKYTHCASGTQAGHGLCCHQDPLPDQAVGTPSVSLLLTHINDGVITYYSDTFETLMNDFSVHPSLRCCSAHTQSRDAIVLLCMLFGHKISVGDFVHGTA